MRAISVRPAILCHDPNLRALVERVIGNVELRFSWLLSWAWVQIFLYQWNFKTRYSHVRFYRRLIQVGSEGDVIALDRLHGQGDLPGNAPICVIFSSLVGGSQDVVEYADQMAKHGFRVIVLHRRGHDGLPLRSHSWNLMGNPEDVDVGIQWIQELYPGAKITLLGVSAGTGLVARYLAMKGDSAPIAGAALICPGWELEHNFSHMNPLISLIFAGGIKRRVLWRHRAVLSTAPRYWYAMIACWNMSSLYRELYGVGGFSNYQDFWGASNPVAQVERITVPIFVFNNKDDGACVWSGVDHTAFERRPNGVLISLPCGGSHLGGYTSWRDPSWMSQTAANLLFALIQRKTA